MISNDDTWTVEATRMVTVIVVYIVFVAKSILRFTTCDKYNMQLFRVVIRIFDVYGINTDGMLNPADKSTTDSTCLTVVKFNITYPNFGHRGPPNPCHNFCILRTEPAGEPFIIWPCSDDVFFVEKQVQQPVVKWRWSTNKYLSGKRHGCCLTISDWSQTFPIIIKH